MIEMMAALAIAGILVLAFIRFLPQGATLFRRIQVHQQTQTQARSAMDAMTMTLRNGIAASVQICSCNDTRCTGGAPDPDPCTTSLAVPPYSQINFSTQDGHWRRFYWRSDNSLIMADAPDAVVTSTATVTVLARNVGSIMFTGDARDLSVVNISLRIDAPLDMSGSTWTVTTMILPTQSVRMISAQ